jgi:pyruvate-formate lyase-activating enzyme
MMAMIVNAGERAILPLSLYDGIRQALENGLTEQELADRLGPIIDTIATDIKETAKQRRLSHKLDYQSRKLKTCFSI